MPLNPILIHPVALKLAKRKGHITDLHSRQTQHLPSFDSDEFKPDHSIYTNAIVSPIGYIYERGGSGGWEWVRHTGACGCEPAAQDRTITKKQAELNSHAKVITLACRWGWGTWHFPMEALVGLYSIPSELLHDQRVLIHITSNAEYSKAWLAMLNIAPDRIIEGTIHAEELIVPLLGGCGSPHIFQIKAIQSTIQNHLHLKSPKTTLIQKQNQNSRKKLIILIERTKHRPLRNNLQLRQAITAYATQNNYKIHLHTDAHLPPLAEQLQLFAKADIVIGPHGGTSVLVPAMQEGKVWLEIMETDSPYENLCGARLSYFCGIRHAIVPSQRFVVKPSHVFQTLAQIFNTPS
jgi:hypothetical protein